MQWASPGGVEPMPAQASSPFLADNGGVQEESDTLSSVANPAMPGRLDANLDAPIDWVTALEEMERSE
jgi:hypothetical protein